MFGTEGTEGMRIEDRAPFEEERKYSMKTASEEATSVLGETRTRKYSPE